MPKVKNPLLSMEARGGIGGLVYNTWRGINTVKTNTSPTGQGTPLRLAAQGLLIAVARLWKGIGNANRTAWGVYAADHPVADWTGSPKRLTGQNWFTRCNLQLARLGLPAVNTPPAIAAPDAVTGFAVTYADDYIQVAWSTPATGDYKMDWWLVGPVSKGITAKLEQAQYLGRQDPADHAGVILVTPAYAGRYTVFARVISKVNGLVSPWVSGFADAL